MWAFHCRTHQNIIIILCYNITILWEFQHSNMQEPFVGYSK